MNRTTALGLLVACIVGLSGCKKGDDVEEPIVPDNTPVQDSDISPRPPKGCGSPFYSVHYGDAYKTLREAEEYKPGARDWYVRELSDRRNEYLNASISANERKEWFGGHKIREQDVQCLGPLFDEIQKAAQRTLPKYHPRGYIHHADNDDDLITAAAKAEVPGATILKVGVKSPTWDIEKLNNGLPRSRYKYGMAWVKSPTFDDGYCRILYINIVQEYSGGGNYAESRANYISKEPAGCK